MFQGIRKEILWTGNQNLRKMRYTKHPLSVFLLFFLCININLITASTNNSQQGCIKGNCEDGYGTYIYPNGDIYQGKWLNNQRHGEGTMTYEGNTSLRGDMYDGEWSQNLRHGWGIYSWSDGNVYEGNWEDNNRHGQGKLYKTSGEWYDGEWRVNIQEGKGTYKFNKTAEWEAHTYTGQWENNKPCCSGEYRYMDGTAFVKDKKASGTGCKMGDCQNGYGEYHYTQDRRYEGEWRNGKFDGEGAFYYDTGEKYIGTWLANKRDGEGQFYDKKGDLVYDGNWKDDVQYGYGIYHYQNGTRYAGQWINGEREGKGRFTIPGTGYYEGEFSLDRFNGQGTFYYSDRSSYEGEWKDNRKHGKGIEYDPDGNIYREGEWADGEFVE